MQSENSSIKATPSGSKIVLRSQQEFALLKTQATFDGVAGPPAPGLCYWLEQIGEVMRGLFLSVLMLAAIGSVSGVADAQPGLSTGLDLDGADNANRIEEQTRRVLLALRKDGIEALQNQNYPVAEKSFSDLLARVPTTTDAHFLMGLAKQGLGNWVEAKQVLEIAVKQEPKRPEPKARLGLTYVRLNDIDSAMKQRAELANLDRKCKGACGDAAGIANGLALLDQALASKRSNADPGH